MSPAPALRVYTDGSCLGNPGPGGWGWVVPDGPAASGAASHTTNQRMEIQAVIEALTSLEEEAKAAGGIEVVSDSTYVVKCFQDKWHAGWLKRGWKNSQGKPVANQDLWEALFAVALDPPVPITFTWVKGHSGDKWNDAVDALATAAAASGSGIRRP